MGTPWTALAAIKDPKKARSALKNVNTGTDEAVTAVKPLVFFFFLCLSCADYPGL